VQRQAWSLARQAGSLAWHFLLGIAVLIELQTV